MRNPDLPIFDIGTLKDDPVSLYDLAVYLFDVVDTFAWDKDSECYKAFKKVVDSLWGNFPPVIVMDFRDPDDPSTWGSFGPPPGATAAV